eukprot:6345631-Amphidinium_carterae.3
MSVAELHSAPDVVAGTMLDRDTNCSDTLVTQQSEPSCSDTIVYEPQGAAAPSSGSDCMPLTYLSEPHSAQALHSHHSDDDLVPLSLLVTDKQTTLPGTSSGSASRQASLAPQVCLLWLFIWLANPVMWPGLVAAVSPMPIVRCTQTQWRRQRRALALICRRHIFHVSHHYPRTSRLLHPLRGVRVGEASHPGPPVGRLIAQTQQTLLDAFSQSSSHRLREASEDPAETAINRDTAYPSPAAEQQLLASTFDVQLLHQTSSVTISVHARPGSRWQWCLMSQPMLLSQFARTPAMALEQFLAKHGAALQPHSRDMLTRALQLTTPPAASREPVEPLRMSIATPRTDIYEDLDMQLDSISLPPVTPPEGESERDLNGPVAPGPPDPAPVDHQRTQVPSVRPLQAHGPHMQHMGLLLVPDTIAVTRSDGKRVSMRRRVMPLYGTCHYAVRAKPAQTGPFKATAALALRAWLTKHGHTLQQESQDELSALIEQVPVEVPLVEQDAGDMHATSTQAPPFSRPEPVEEQALPDWTQLETIASMDLATQRHIPRQLHAAIQSATLQLLHSSSLERDNHAHGQPSAAHLLFVLPKLLWPQPRSDHEGPMASRARLQLIRQRVHLLQQGRYQDLVDLALDTAEKQPPPPQRIEPQQAATGGLSLRQARHMHKYATRGRVLTGMK